MTRAAIAGLLFFLIVTIGYAQPYFSRDRSFTVSEIRGCNPLTITITVVPDQADGITCASFAYRPFGTSTDTRTSPPGGVCSVTFTYDILNLTQTSIFNLQLFTGGVGSGNDDEIKITIDPNLKPEFDIYSCDNQKAQVIIKDRIYDQYFVDFNYNTGNIQSIPAGNSPTSQFNYTSPGLKRIGVKGKKSNSANNCNVLEKTFTAVPNLSDATIQNLTIKDAGAVELGFNASENTRYRAEIAINNSATFQTIKEFYFNATGPQTGKFSEPDIRLNTNDFYYCFRLRKYDPCANTSTIISSTPLICTTNLKATAENNKNVLSWIPSGSTGVIDYTIKRNSVTNFTTSTSNNFEDTDVECTEQYCYTIITNYPGGAKSTSVEKCVTAFSTEIPDAVADISSTVNDQVADLKWLNPVGYNPDVFSIRRAQGDLNFLTIEELPDTTFSDLQYGIKPFTAYQISYTDECGNKSPVSQAFQPITLEGVLNTDNSIQLYWNNYFGYADGVAKYEITKYDKDNVALQTFTPPNQTDTLYLDNPDPLFQDQLVRYRVTATPVSSLPEKSFSNTIEFIREPRLIFPTAFTPDGFGPAENEGFKVFGQYISKIRLQIFDRWGKLLFTANDLQTAWDGKSDGTELPQSSYVWRAEITDLIGREYIRTGSVALLRDKP